MDPYYNFTDGKNLTAYVKVTEYSPILRTLDHVTLEESYENLIIYKIFIYKIFISHTYLFIAASEESSTHSERLLWKALQLIWQEPSVMKEITLTGLHS